MAARAADYPDLPHLDPPPFTTIARRLVHISECKFIYLELAFRTREADVSRH